MRATRAGPAPGSLSKKPLRTPDSRRRGGFSVIEALLVSAIASVLMVVVWWLFSSSSRVMERGQAKVEDTAQAELLFRHLEKDLHTLVAAPGVATDPPQLVVERYVRDGASGRFDKVQVAWIFRPGPLGEGSFVERRPGSGSPGETRRFLLGSLESYALEPLAIPGRPGLSLRLVLRSRRAPAPTIYSEAFFFHTQILDPDWNPVANL